MTDLETNPIEPERIRPLGYSESFSQWLRLPSLKASEYQVLQHLSFFPKSDGKREARLNRVDIGDKQFLNEFEITNLESPKHTASASATKNLVVLHGYGASMVFFYRNFKRWSSIPGSRTFALDMLGFGRSSRPRFQIATKDMTARDTDGRFKAVVETENWFIDSLERWRIAKNIDKFTLMGHSMGGYLAAAYAFKYPERVEKLVMISPAGVERGYDPVLEEKSLFSRGIRDRQEVVLHNTAPDVKDELNKVEGQKFADPAYEAAEIAQRTTRQVPNLFIYLWNQHVSPFSVLRWSGAFGPKLVSRWTSWRFGNLPLSEQQALHSYSYRAFTAKGSGEYGITRLLAAGAVAREPLVDRVADKLQCPSLWLYGDDDWMNIKAGREAVNTLQSKAVNKNARDADIHIVPEAGHHLYLDNPGASDKFIVDFLEK